jgi:hypothetical protein
VAVVHTETEVAAGTPEPGKVGPESPDRRVDTKALNVVLVCNAFGSFTLHKDSRWGGL